MARFSIFILSAFLVIASGSMAHAIGWKVCVDGGGQREILIKPYYINDALSEENSAQMIFDIGVPGQQSSPNSDMSSFQSRSLPVVTSKEIKLNLAGLDKFPGNEKDTFPMGKYLEVVIPRSFEEVRMTTVDENGRKTGETFVLECRDNGI